MGRRQYSIEELKASGTYRPSRHGNGKRREKKFVVNFPPLEEVPPCPDYIKNEKVKNEWYDFIDYFMRIGTVNSVNIILVEHAFKCLDIAEGIYNLIQEKYGGMENYVKQYNAKSGKNYLPKEWTYYLDKWYKTMFDFGCTPAGRAKLGIEI